MASQYVVSGFSWTVIRVSGQKHRLRKHGVRRGKTRRQRFLLNAMALGAGSLLAVVADSVFCPLTLSRRLLRFAAPALRPLPECVRSGFSRTP
jgi:hypothetical protein